MAAIHDRIPYTANRNPGTALILITDLPDGRKLVVCADENEDDDAAVNMVVEELRRTVCDRHRLDPARLVWVEYVSQTIQTGSGQLGGWELVTFEQRTGKPSWRQMTDQDWREIGTEPPPAPVPQRPPDQPRRGGF